jgi:hypothetical protein
MATSIEKYINAGIAVLGSPDNTSPRTLITVGVARGGTSLVAGSLHHLGVFHGDQSYPPVFEDLRLSGAFEGGSAEKPAAVISDYNSRQEIWGWKRPSNLHYLGRLDRMLRNPLYIVIFKDVFSIANRNRISMGVDIAANLAAALDQYSVITDFIATSRSAKLLVSYDKAIADSDFFLDALCDFSGIQPASDQLKAAKTFITPNPSDYLEMTRADRIVGHIDVVADKRVTGWASRMHDDGWSPIDVRLIVNGSVCQTTAASLFRPDLKRLGINRSGNAGFEFLLPDHQPLRKGDEVRVLAGDHEEELKNSPWVF